MGGNKWCFPLPFVRCLNLSCDSRWEWGRAKLKSAFYGEVDFEATPPHTAFFFLRHTTHPLLPFWMSRSTRAPRSLQQGLFAGAPWNATSVRIVHAGNARRGFVYTLESIADLLSTCTRRGRRIKRQQTGDRISSCITVTFHVQRPWPLHFTLLSGDVNFCNRIAGILSEM